MQTHFSSQEERRWAASEAFNQLEDEFPTLWSASIAPKSIFLSEGMCYLKITGIYMPLTLEANVNTAIRPDELAATMCHELSHLRGYMEEAEANFIAYLACIKSDDKECRYAGTLLALIHAKNALYKADPDKNSEINALLSDGVKRDLTARNAFWQQYETPVAQVAESINDGYLKLNQQSDGVKSYGRMVDLLLGLAGGTKERITTFPPVLPGGWLSFLRPFRGSVFPLRRFLFGFFGGDSFLRGGFFLRRVRLVRFRPHKGRVYPGFQGFGGDTLFCEHALVFRLGVLRVVFFMQIVG